MTPSNIDTLLLALLAAAKAFSMLVAWFTAKAATKATEEVKQTLVDSTAQVLETAKKTDAKLEVIHQATNGGVGVALEIAAAALDRVAQITKSPFDIKAADLAREKYNQHMTDAEYKPE